MQPAFCMGSTSYVYPLDLVANVRRLVGIVQDVELVLFDTPAASNLPDAAQVAALAEIAAISGLTFTVHLPLDLHYTADETHASLRLAARVIQLTAALRPDAFVFHLDTTGLADNAAWTTRSLRAVDWLMRQVDDPGVLTLENLESSPPDALEPVFTAFPLSRALDIGHLWKQDREALPVLVDWLATGRLRVVHLHGLAAGRDHQSLALTAPLALDAVLRELWGWPGVLTLEVFEGDFWTSLDALRASIRRIHHA